MVGQLILFLLLVYIQETSFKDNCYIPKVYWNLSSQQVLTCEWIDGVKFDSRESLQKNGFNVEKIMNTMVKIFADVHLIQLRLI